MAHWKDEWDAIRRAVGSTIDKCTGLADAADEAEDYAVDCLPEHHAVWWQGFRSGIQHVKTSLTKDIYAVLSESARESMIKDFPDSSSNTQDSGLWVDVHDLEMLEPPEGYGLSYFAYSYVLNKRHGMYQPELAKMFGRAISTISGAVVKATNWVEKSDEYRQFIEQVAEDVDAHIYEKE